MNQILVFDAILEINLHFKLILSYVVSHNTLFKVANLWSCKQESLSYFVLGSMWKVWNKNLVLWRSMDLNRNIKKRSHEIYKSFTQYKGVGHADWTTELIVLIFP